MKERCIYALLYEAPQIECIKCDTEQGFTISGSNSYVTTDSYVEDEGVW